MLSGKWVEVGIFCYDGYEEECSKCGHRVRFEKSRGVDGRALILKDAPAFTMYENKFFDGYLSNVMVRCEDHLPTD